MSPRAPNPRLARRAASLALALALGASFGASPAAAQSAVDGQLEAIREQVFQARFGEAIAAAQALLARTDLDASQRNAALEVLATAQIANRNRGAAARTLEQLYARDPGHRLTDRDASPPVIAAFARAREQAPPPVAVRVTHQPPQLARRESPQIVARIAEGADAVAELRLVYRSHGADAGRVVMTPRGDGTFVGRIPVVGAASQPSQASYHLVALAPSMTPLGQLGSEADPMRLTIPAGSSVGAGGGRVSIEEERPPVLGGAAPGRQGGADGSADGPTDDTGDGGGSVVEEWWFWTLIAVLVVGGAVTAGVVLGTQGGGPPEGSLGVGQLMLRF